jgi:multidrug efflux pump subunit AcrA (membrane-fusion protein)
MKPDNTVELRPVKPGQRQDGDLTVVESGVEPDETVVVTGQLALAPGTKVEPKPYKSPQTASEGNSTASKSVP